jgi:hypothetical protein
MKKIVRLTESDLIKLVKRVIKEEENQTPAPPRNITLSLDCGKKTVSGLALTSQMIDKWCPKAIVKPSPQPTQSNPSSPSSAAF